MANDCLEGVSVVWWFMPIFTLFPKFVHHFLKLLLWLLELQFKRRKFGTWQNMAWKTFLLFGYSCLPYKCASKWLQRCYFLKTFFANVGFQVGKKTLRTWQTVFRKMFLLFGDLSKSSRLPCMYVKIVPKGICFFSDLIRTWQHMVWKAFLLFGDLCQSSQVSTYSNGSGDTFFHFLVVVGI